MFIAGACAYVLGVAVLAVRLQGRTIKPSHALAVTVAQIPIALALLVFATLEIAGSAGCFD
jgi:predicted Co/Zn/Cd cation transporter (cation efflux family)